MGYYPVYLDLENRRCVVVGGNGHAVKKVSGLLKANANVTVIAPNLNVELETLAEAGRITVVRRPYRPGDLEGASLAISTTMDPAMNAQVWEEAVERNMPINSMHDVSHCNFIAPAIVRQGDLIIAISTSGTSPALAVRLRQRLSREFEPAYGRFLELVAPLRQELPRLYSDFEQRRTIWYRLVDSEVIGLLRQGDEASARARIQEIVYNSSASEEAE